MQAGAKETVIIVHGTWAAPEPGNARWYQPIDGVPAAWTQRCRSAALGRGAGHIAARVIKSSIGPATTVGSHARTLRPG